mmetsp:Transcript_12536/g.15751  ORF Transcript_12536/g.15751 Transcript_12536/m.15751 type:complete len:167 (+) Transcript_12536:31-531(+)|eukprot:CAMPEP_0172497070 /NCGR_PEP_ID=MMETSP1066-20121228/94797_1 /TAXON_ID=671091 /ORGANISM="Coscinodiscus wailesii, Strain CCMP2513" /LENGTH=166 /DNA_ID=CAMNT_0013269647 /DNA_START=29 /DNA_END=529 /DNA_ORIENTATION=+
MKLCIAQWILYFAVLFCSHARARFNNDVLEDALNHLLQDIKGAASMNHSKSTAFLGGVKATGFQGTPTEDVLDDEKGCRVVTAYWGIGCSSVIMDINKVEVGTSRSNGCGSSTKNVGTSYSSYCDDGHSIYEEFDNDNCAGDPTKTTDYYGCNGSNLYYECINEAC